MTTTVLRQHRLAHIPELHIDHVIFEPRFAHGCSMGNCNAHCCRDGVWLDPSEKQRILDHADLIRRHMVPGQETDPARWFDNVTDEDADYPSGVSEGTAVTDRGCVFLDDRGWCALQKAASASGMDKFALKPYFCVAFPLTIQSGVLTVDDPDFTNRPMCCSIVEGEATHAPADVCREELEFMVGKEGMEEIAALRQTLGR